jgi:hypothetical protein
VDLEVETNVLDFLISVKTVIDKCKIVP